MIELEDFSAQAQKLPFIILKIRGTIDIDISCSMLSCSRSPDEPQELRQAFLPRRHDMQVGSNDAPDPLDTF